MSEGGNAKGVEVGVRTLGGLFGGFCFVQSFGGVGTGLAFAVKVIFSARRSCIVCFVRCVWGFEHSKSLSPPVRRRWRASFWLIYRELASTQGERGGDLLNEGRHELQRTGGKVTCAPFVLVGPGSLLEAPLWAVRSGSPFGVWMKSYGSAVPRFSTGQTAFDLKVACE